MKIPMSEGGVPLAVTYRRILRKPKMTRERKFVGVVRLAKNLLVKAIETVEAAAFETKITYLDEGESVVAHWAITVGNPFDTSPGKEMKNLVAFRINSEDELPPSGVHFEVITPPRKAPEGVIAPINGASGKKADLAHDLTPEQFETLRRRQQDELLKDTRDKNGVFQRPANAAYAPRPVKTIDKEAESPPKIIPVETDEATDENAENLDWPRRLGEDD